MHKRLSGWLPSPVALLAFLVLSQPVLAEAGISEIAKERAYWLCRPYAMYKRGDNITGPVYSLVKARPQSWFEKHEPFSAPSGMVIEEVLIAQVPRYAMHEGIILAETNPTGLWVPEDQAEWAVVDLRSPPAEVRWYATGKEAWAGWRDAVGSRVEPVFHTFEDELLASQVWAMSPVAIGLGATLILPAFALVSSAERERRFDRAGFVFCALSVAWAIGAIAYWWSMPAYLGMVVCGLLAALCGIITYLVSLCTKQSRLARQRWVKAVSLGATLVGLFYGTLIGPRIVDFLVAMYLAPRG